MFVFECMALFCRIRFPMMPNGTKIPSNGAMATQSVRLFNKKRTNHPGISPGVDHYVFYMAGEINYATPLPKITKSIHMGDLRSDLVVFGVLCCLWFDSLCLFWAANEQPTTVQSPIHVQRANLCSPHECDCAIVKHSKT